MFYRDRTALFHSPCLPGEKTGIDFALDSSEVFECSQQFVAAAAAQAPAETLRQRTMATRTLLPLCVCLALQPPQTPRRPNRRYAATQEPPPAD